MITWEGVDVRGRARDHRARAGATYGSEKDGTLHRAVDSVDLDVATGEVFALLGPNGAGQDHDGRDPRGAPATGRRDRLRPRPRPGPPHPAWRTRIGIVLQDSGAIELLTVQEVVEHFATYYPAPREVDEVIASVGLEEKRETRVRHLSGGQRRRLDVALGIVGRPELLFLDEPTTGFDPEARRRFWDLIRDLNADGTTILLTTHYLEEAEQLADRLAVIASGRVLEVNDPQRLGGRAQAAAVVSWTEGGAAREVSTSTPTRSVAELAARFDAEVPDLAVTASDASRTPISR